MFFLQESYSINTFVLSHSFAPNKDFFIVCLYIFLCDGNINFSLYACALICSTLSLFVKYLAPMVSLSLFLIGSESYVPVYTVHIKNIHKTRLSTNGSGAIYYCERKQSWPPNFPDLPGNSRRQSPREACRSSS